MQVNNTSRISFSTLLLVSPFFLWGTAMVAMKGAMDHTTPLFMAGIRLFPAGLLVLAVGAMTGRKMPHNWQGWLWIALFALADGTLFQGFLAEGLMRTNAGLGSVMIDSQPLAVAMLSWWLFQEKIGLIGGIGLAIGVFGISLIGLPDEWIWRTLDGSITNTGLHWEQLFEHGEWLMLLAALSMAIGTVMMPMVSCYVDPVIATGWHMILGGLPLFVGSWLWEADQWLNLNGYDWMALAYSTVFGSAIAYTVFFYFASNGNLTSLSALTFLTPVFALLFGNLFLAESLSDLQWTGVLFTLLSIYLINQREVIKEKLFSPLPEVRSEVNASENNHINVADSVQVSSSKK